jgi:hypothetical protein
MRVFILTILLLLSACSSLNAIESSDNEEYDYYVIFSNLLGINESRFSYTDSNGKSHSDQLKLFKELEDIYLKYAKNGHDNGIYTKEQIKVIMLFAFYAENRNSGAFNEYLASDLKPIYSKNQQAFLDSMVELPFLISPTCNRLNAFFGFEGKNVSGKEAFIKENEANFEKYLNNTQVKACLSQFSK